MLLSAKWLHSTLEPLPVPGSLFSHDFHSGSRLHRGLREIDIASGRSARDGRRATSRSSAGFRRERARSTRRNCANHWETEPFQGASKSVARLSAIRSAAPLLSLVRGVRIGRSCRPAHKPHSANQTVTVHYRFHPLAGTRVTAVEHRSHRGEPIAAVSDSEGRRYHLPLWMTVPEAAQWGLRERPRLSLSALSEVRDLIAAWSAEPARPAAGDRDEISNAGEVAEDADVRAAAPGQAGASGERRGGKSSASVTSRSSMTIWGYPALVFTARALMRFSRPCARAGSGWCCRSRRQDCLETAVSGTRCWTSVPSSAAWSATGTGSTTRH